MNDLKLAFFLAIKSIIRGNVGSFIMVIFIMMVVFINLLFTDAIFAGISKGIGDNKVNYQYGEIIIEPKVTEKFISSSDVRDIINLYKDERSVLKISYVLKTGAVYVNKKDGDGRDEAKISGTLMGISIDENENVFDIEPTLLDGRYLTKGDEGKIVLGAGLSGGYGSSMFAVDLEGVKIGEKVSVEFNGLRRDYEIIGIFETKSSSTDRMGIILKDELRVSLGLNNEASEIIFRLESRDDSKQILGDLEKTEFSKYEISD
jgi:putative ABC transport system permease protein